MGRRYIAQVADTALKLYCRYEYTRPYMKIVSGVKINYDYRWMVMLDFIYMGSADLFGTKRERKIQNENMFPAGFEPTPRQSTTGKSAP